MIEKDRRGHPYCGESQDEQLRKLLPNKFSLVKNESQRFEDDQIPS